MVPPAVTGGTGGGFGQGAFVIDAPGVPFKWLSECGRGKISGTLPEQPCQADGCSGLWFFELIDNPVSGTIPQAMDNLLDLLTFGAANLSHS